MKTARNVAIIVLLALLVSQAPGGLTAAETTSNILSVLFFAGLAFFAYRMYMENRMTLFDLPDNQRLILYGSVGTIFITLVATERIWDTEGPLIMLWFALLAGAVYGLAFVFRAWREDRAY